jgi:hypothetical protein
LKIVASQDIGDLGPKDGPPVSFPWRWYYSIPSLPLWALIIVLLIAPKANRNRQAWLILIPLGVVLIVWRVPAGLFSLSDKSTEIIACFVVSIAFAWSTVWLIGHWLANLGRWSRFFLSFGMMVVVGLLSCYCHLAGTSDFAFVVIYDGLFMLILWLAVTCAARLSRKKYTPRRFLSWFALWNVLAALGVLLSFVAVIALVMLCQIGSERAAGQLVVLFSVATISSFVVAVCLYLITLPFLILAFNNPFYRDRFERLFCLQHNLENTGEPPECLQHQEGNDCRLSDPADHSE